MKKVVSVLFSMLLVGFLVMTSGAIAEEAPESSSNEEAIFGSASEGSVAPEASEDSEMFTRALLDPAETPETQYQEGFSSIPESSQEQETAPADTTVN